MAHSERRSCAKELYFDYCHIDLCAIYEQGAFILGWRSRCDSNADTRQSGHLSRVLGYHYPTTPWYPGCDSNPRPRAFNSNIPSRCKTLPTELPRYKISVLLHGLVLRPATSTLLGTEKPNQGLPQFSARRLSIRYPQSKPFISDHSSTIFSCLPTHKG